MVWPALAQNDRLSDIEKMEVVPKKDKKKASKPAFRDRKTLSMDYVNHYACGWNLMNGPVFKNGFGPSMEYIFNWFGISYSPSNWFSIDVCVDFKADRYTALPEYEFSILDDGNLKVSDNTAHDKMRSTVSTETALSIPVALCFHSRYAGLKLGVDVNVPGKKNNMTDVISKYQDGNTSIRATTSGGIPGELTYDYFAAILFGDIIGVYCKYCPCDRFPTANFKIANYFTLGLYLNL